MRFIDLSAIIEKGLDSVVLVMSLSQYKDRSQIAVPLDRSKLHQSQADFMILEISFIGINAT